MSKPAINSEECIGCGACADACPQDVIAVADGVATCANPDDCIGCGACVDECPMGIIQIVED